MVSHKHCAYKECKNNSKHPEKETMRGTFFIPVPKRGRNKFKCQLWVDTIGRSDFTIYNVTRSSYVCSKHFVGGRGPTLEHPDPLPWGIEVNFINDRVNEENEASKHIIEDIVFSNPENIAVDENRIEDDSEDSCESRPEDWPTCQLIHVTRSAVDRRQERRDKKELLTPERDPNGDYKTTRDSGWNSSDDEDHNYKFKTTWNEDTSEESDWWWKGEHGRYREVTESERQKNRRKRKNAKKRKAISKSVLSPKRIKTDLNQSTTASPAANDDDDLLNEANFEDDFAEKLYSQTREVVSPLELLPEMLPNNWGYVILKDQLCCCKYASVDCLPVISLKIDALLRFSIKINGFELQETHHILESVSKKIGTQRELLKLIDILDSQKICEGNQEERFVSLASLKFPQGYFCKQSSAMRSNKCNLFIKDLRSDNTKRCDDCVYFRKVMRGKTLRSNDGGVTGIKRIRVDYLNDEEVRIQLKSAQNQLRQLKSRNQTLQQQLDAAKARDRQALEQNTELEELNKIEKINILKLEKNIKQNISSLAPESFQRMILEDQLRIQKSKNKKINKWNPNIIKWCLEMRKKSPTEYASLQKHLVLPSNRTLCKHSNTTGRPATDTSIMTETEMDNESAVSALLEAEAEEGEEGENETSYGEIIFHKDQDQNQNEQAGKVYCLIQADQLPAGLDPANVIMISRADNYAHEVILEQTNG